MQTQSKAKSYKIIAAIILAIVAAVLYYNFNPELVKLFPPCIFKTVTGLKCPGCGSQRAVHYLLHFDIVNAFFRNPLLVLSLPYMLVGFLIEYTRIGKDYPKLKKVLFGKIAAYSAFAITTVYWITRNIFDF